MHMQNANIDLVQCFSTSSCCGSCPTNLITRQWDSTYMALSIIKRKNNTDNHLQHWFWLRPVPGNHWVYNNLHCTCFYVTYLLSEQEWVALLGLTKSDMTPISYGLQGIWQGFSGFRKSKLRLQILKFCFMSKKRWH